MLALSYAIPALVVLAVIGAIAYGVGKPALERSRERQKALVASTTAPSPPPPGAAPAVTTTVIITIFFGVFGAIPAAIHTNHASSSGHSDGRYWKAFGIVFGIELLLSLLAVATFALVLGTA